MGRFYLIQLKSLDAMFCHNGGIMGSDAAINSMSNFLSLACCKIDLITALNVNWILLWYSFLVSFRWGASECWIKKGFFLRQYLVCLVTLVTLLYNIGSIPISISRISTIQSDCFVNCGSWILCSQFLFDKKIYNGISNNAEYAVWLVNLQSWLKWFLHNFHINSL